MFSEDRIYTQYFQDVSRARMPASAQDERRLFERYIRTGDQDARRLIVEGGLRFVIKTAKHYYRGDSDFLKTLIAAGNVGLMVAVDNYRPWVIRCPRSSCHVNNYVAHPKGQRCKKCNRALRSWEAEKYTTRFLTYAAWWISEAIRTELYASSLVHIPPYKQKEHHRARKEGKEVGFSYLPYDESLDEAVVQVPMIDTEAVLTDMHARRLLYRMLRTMRDRHAFVVIAYFGLRENPKTLREIASKLGVCSERVRQIKVDAMVELRTRLLANNVQCTSDAYSN
jgi:RNA polymerase primary sigma factor